MSGLPELDELIQPNCGRIVSQPYEDLRKVTRISKDMKRACMDVDEPNGSSRRGKSTYANHDGAPPSGKSGTSHVRGCTGSKDTARVQNLQIWELFDRKIFLQGCILVWLAWLVERDNGSGGREDKKEGEKKPMKENERIEVKKTDGSRITGNNVPPGFHSDSLKGNPRVNPVSLCRDRGGFQKRTGRCHKPTLPVCMCAANKAFRGASIMSIKPLVR
ncbi:hypothetical protein EDD16DRAFT_1527637 [Pisolithus croceorrhizus]|nr:hypothetical protein EDD16DRAFT_1527637 [Pisolithus croceorrhizus]